MTRRRLQQTPPLVSSERRGRGLGEPAPHPVPPAIDMERPWLLDSRAVAGLLGIGRTKTFQMMSSGALPTVRIGRCVRVPADALVSWIDQHRTDYEYEGKHLLAGRSGLRHNR